MAGPSVTYTFVNATVSDASQVNQNFTDLVNGATDGTKDYNINALTAAGTATLNGNVILGNAASDTIAANGYVSTNLTIKSTDATATAGPDIIIDRDSASAADSDAIGRIIFRGNDDAGTPADNDYASIEASIVDSGAGSEDGKLDFKVTQAGTATSYLTIEATKGVAIRGRTDGNSVASGYVGEVITATFNSPAIGSAGSWTTVHTLTLNKGVYSISGSVSLGTTTSVVWGADAYFGINITTIAGTGQISQYLTHGLTLEATRNVTADRTLVVTADSTPVYIQGMHNMTTTTGASWPFSSSGISYGYAIRIA